MIQAEVHFKQPFPQELPQELPGVMEIKLNNGYITIKHMGKDGPTEWKMPVEAVDFIRLGNQ